MEEIAGDLLGDSDPAGGEAESDDASPPALRTGTPENDGGPGIAGAGLGALAVLALLGVGALGELGRLRPRAMKLQRRALVGR